MQSRLWWTETLRGMLSLAFGILYFLVYNFVFFLIYAMGGYLVLDGFIDLYRAIAKKRVPHHHLSMYRDAAISIAIGLICFFVPTKIFLALGLLFTARIIGRGIQVCGEARRSQARYAGFHWLYGILLAILGLTLLIPPVLAVIIDFLVFLIGFYAFCDGFYLLQRGVRLRRAASRDGGAPLVAPPVPNPLDIPAQLPSTTRRALIFVRRAGAAGLGHIGWAFEWDNGWFNVGAVENRGRRSYARAERTDFWTAHTINPVATMQEVGQHYDAYKLFYVTRPQSKHAWRVVVWVSRCSYSVLRRNCVDATYDVLRTYGIANLPDPATEYAPNDWYDSLASPDYAIRDYPHIPLHLHRQSQRELATREILFTIPAHISSTIPPWRQRGRRGLAELTLAWDKMLIDVKASFTRAGRTIARRQSKKDLPELSGQIE